MLTQPETTSAEDCSYERSPAASAIPNPRGHAISGELLEALLGWARSKPFLIRMWLVGSRLRGDHPPDSDLDIAIEIRKVGLDGNPYASFVYRHQEWVEELQTLCPHKIHLLHYNLHCDHELTPAEGNVVKIVEACSLLIHPT